MNARDVVRAMRPYQRRVAPLMIEDVLNGEMPLSVAEALRRYAPRIGDPVPFDTGKGWSGDLREAAIWTLLRNGFAKGRAVILAEDGTLSAWSTDRQTLEAAATIEFEFGANGALSRRRDEFLGQLICLGQGPRAVYVYTDSRLDSLGDRCCKIGRHDRSGEGEVLQRVLQQYSTGNPGHPVLRVIARVEDEVALEGILHRQFAGQRIPGVFGKEWFAVSCDEVVAAIRRHLDPGSDPISG